MTEDGFDRDVRAMLAARDPGPAPARLEITVRDTLRSAASVERTGAMRALARWGLAAAGLAALLLVGVVILRPTVPGSTGVGNPAPSAPTTLQPGDGVAAGPLPPVIPVILWVAAIGGLIAAARRSRRRLPAGIALVLAVAIGGLGLAVGTGQHLAYGSSGGWQPSFETDPAGPIIATNGDGPFTVIMAVRNSSWLALDVRGLAPPEPSPAPDGSPRPLPPRFVAAGLDETSDLLTSTPFRSFVLQPGEERQIFLLGAAGDCAIPGRVDGQESTIVISTVDLVYEQLGVVATAAVPLPSPLVVLLRKGCSPS